ARASARGPERALCIIRQAAATSRDDSLEGSDERPLPQLDGRGFLRRCKESMAMAALRERPLAVAVIQLDGISDIAQIIATKVSEQIMSTAILRLPAKSDERDGKPWWYLGQLSESLLALVLESADREAIGECVAALSASLREPIAIGGAEFHLTPYAGVRWNSAPPIAIGSRRLADNAATHSPIASRSALSSTSASRLSLSCPRYHQGLPSRSSDLAGRRRIAVLMICSETLVAMICAMSLMPSSWMTATASGRSRSAAMAIDSL